MRELVNFLDQSGASYYMLYVSDPYTSLQCLPNLSRRRILADNTSENSTTCDGVCQIKSSLLEGFFVVSYSFLVTALQDVLNLFILDSFCLSLLLYHAY